MLDREGALAAIPKMLPADTAKRTRMLEGIRRTVHAAGAATGERAERLAQIEELFRSGRQAVTTRQVPRKTRRLTKA